MSVSSDVKPYQTSIVRFVAKMHQQIEPLFTQVIMICDEENLCEPNMFAIDGCKIQSNTSKKWNSTFEALWRKKQN